VSEAQIIADAITVLAFVVSLSGLAVVIILLAIVIALSVKK